MVPASLREFDLVVVIDEWKGSGASPAPAYFAARAFATRDPGVGLLYAELENTRAAAWHASGSRTTHAFLFSSPAFRAILELLNKSDTCLYDTLRDVAAFEAPEVEQSWRAMLERSPDIKHIWNVNDIYARALFRFAEDLAGYLGQ